MDEPLIGTIMYFALPFEPRGWLLCDGRPVSGGTKYEALRGLLKTTYDPAGQRCLLPDLRGTSLVSMGVKPGTATNYELGKAGGHESATLAVANMPSHQHLVNNPPISIVGTEATAPNPQNNYMAKPSNAKAALYGSDKDDKKYTGNLSATADVTGGGETFINQPQYQVIPCYIAYEGIYPSKP